MIPIAMRPLVALCGLLGGCSGCEAAAPPPNTKQAIQDTRASSVTDLPRNTRAIQPALADEFVKRGERMRLELVSRGAEPRQVRTHVGAAATQRVLVDCEIGELGAGSSKGSWLLRLERRDDKLTVTPERIDEMVGLVGKSATIHFGNDARRINVVLPALSAAEQQGYAALEYVARDLLVPFPADAIGEGARWRVQSRTVRAGAERVRLVDYLLAGDQIEAVVHEVLLAQPLDIPGGLDPALGPVAIQVIAGSAVGKMTLPANPWTGASLRASIDLSTALMTETDGTTNRFTTVERYQLSPDP